MREGWSYKKLGEVASYINGYAFKPEQWKKSGTPIIRIQNLNNPDAPYNYYDGEVPEKVKIKNGDLLISWSASLGAYIWDGGDAFLNQHIFKVEFDKIDIDKMYLKYAVTSKLEAMANLVHGATMKHIVKKDFDNTLVPYPSKSQQEAIVSELDEINSLLTLKREQLQTYDKLAQSLFYEMFGDPVENEKGWEVQHITDVCLEISAGGDASKHEIRKNQDESFTIPVYSNGIESEGLYGYSNHATISQPAITLAARGTIGAAFIRREPYIPIIRLVSVMPDLFIIDLVYLYFILKQTQWDNTGGTIPQLPVPKVKQLMLPVPSLELQHTFAQRYEAIEKQKTSVKAAIEKLETLLNSRMDYWFVIQPVAEQIVENSMTEDIIKEIYQEYKKDKDIIDGTIHYDNGSPYGCTDNNMDFRLLVDIYNYMKDSGETSLESIEGRYSYTSHAKECVLELNELGLLTSDDLKTFHIV